MLDLVSIADGLQVLSSRETILEYHFAPDGVRPYWHPLRLPDSPILTMNQPADHVHHQGMWVAWKSVNGVNFWEQPRPGADPTGFGHIEHQEITESSVSPEQVRFSAKNAWLDWEDTHQMSELRTTTVYPAKADHWWMDICIEFQADMRDVTLDLKRGKAGGGGLFYSGLMIRFDNPMTPGQMLDSEGRTETDAIFGSRASWCSFSAVHPDDDQTYGITIIDHPDNWNHPTTWWVRNGKDYGILHPSPCYQEKIELQQGESAQFQYRVVVHRESFYRSLAEEAAWS